MRITESRAHRGQSAFTLAEVVVSIALAAMMFSGLICGYIGASYRAEWSGYSLAAQSLAIQQIEQAKAAKWDPWDPSGPVCEYTNLQKTTAAALDIPLNGGLTNAVWATNFTTVTALVPVDSVVGTNLVSLIQVRVDTVWPFLWRNKTNYYTNTVVDYFAPD
jgi:type II secretory pathway pseudopilin PulG